MAYSKYYPEGWKNNESGGTPITAGALNHMETGIKTAVDNMDNTGSNVVTYTSEDQADSAVTRSTGWTTVSALVSGMTHSNLFNSMSKMFKNIRWLYKMLGTTDISSISSAGTVTGAIAKLNTDKIKDIKIIETISYVTTTAVIAAHGGKSWTSIGGAAIVPSVPSGYTFVGNVNVTCNGLVGVSAAFDGDNQMTSQSVNPYMFNANTAQVNTGSNMRVRLYSVCVKY